MQMTKSASDELIFTPEREELLEIVFILGFHDFEVGAKICLRNCANPFCHFPFGPITVQSSD